MILRFIVNKYSIDGYMPETASALQLRLSLDGRDAGVNFDATPLDLSCELYCDVEDPMADGPSIKFELAQGEHVIGHYSLSLASIFKSKEEDFFSLSFGKRAIVSLNVEIIDEDQYESNSVMAEVEQVVDLDAEFSEVVGSPAGSSSSFLNLSYSEIQASMESSRTTSGRGSPVGKDFCGMLVLEVVSAEHVPLCTSRPNRNGPPSPFVVVSVGRKSFKTKTIQRSINPVWRERLYLPVYEKELGYHLSFSLYDYRQLGVNSLIGSVNLPLSGFTDNPEQRLTLPLELVPVNPTHREQTQAPPPMLLLKGTFHGLQNLQEIFWRALCKQFDQNDSGSLDFVELELMLSCVAPNLSEDSIKAISEMLGTSRGRTSFDYGEIACCLSSQNLFDTRSVSGISVGECPICTKILQNEQSGYDVLMHVAVCAERNASGKLENVMMGGFLTEEHASRKWLARLFSFVSYGGYQLGKNNANIFVQDRLTGKVMEEKMPAYIRLGIRLIYQSSGGTRADTKMIRKIMQSMTLRQGRKFSGFESRKSILPFIKFHGLAIDEVLDPIDSFRNFNEFFYRKLKPGARKAASVDPTVSLCPADCRLSCFPTIDEATRIWVKGTNFTVTSLLRDGQLGDYFAGGSMAICRLAPQDYHRFHSPCEAAVNLVYHIPGAYFTVNPMAIRQRIDVFTENARTVVILDSPVFGKIAYVAIGAMMVGSIEITCKAGDQLARLDEIGYFAFGGSTIVMLFAPGAHVFDEDLLENSRECLETLVKVGQTLGHKL